MKIKEFPIAILQGRLSPDVDGRYQFFPKQNWQEEFRIAKTLGFDGVEWLVDPMRWENNPIFFDAFDEAERLSQETLIPIVSACADWFMQVCLWEGDPEWHRNKLRLIFARVAKMTNRLILVPLLETHNITDIEIQKKIVSVLKPLANEMESQGIHIGFETELNAAELISFIEMFESPAFGVYYDIGNCTSYGFDCAKDIKKLNLHIKGVHVKDRKIGTTTPLPLGQGDADYRGVISALREIDWEGTLVMQAWRGEDFVDDAKRQMEFIRNIF